MAISRIDLADFGSPDRIAQEIIRLFPDFSIPVPIETIALQLDISSIEALETEGFDGGLFTDENKSAGFILVRQSMPRQRRRFTIGHELFHFLCPTHQPLRPDGFLCTCDDMRLNYASALQRAKQMEVEANSFSSKILLPAPYFLKDLQRTKGADIENILDLARRYDTSKEATARRYVELHDEPCAAVISRNGRLLRFYRAKNFPYLDVRPGTALPAQSRSAQVDSEIGKATEWLEVDPDAWPQSGSRAKLPAFYEQVLRQNNGYVLTLLTADISEVDEDEDRDLEESYAVRFRK